MDRGWVRFLIHFAITIGLIIVSCWLYTQYYDWGLPDQFSGLFIFGALSFLGPLFIFFAHNLLRDSDGIGAVFRVIFSVIGGLIIIGGGGYLSFGYASISVPAWYSSVEERAQLLAASPWLSSLGRVFMLGGVIFCIIYYVLIYCDVDVEILFLFAPIVAYPLAYIITVPFSFLYKVSGFVVFNGWPEMFLSLLAAVIVLVGHLREWDPISVSLPSRHSTRISRPSREKKAKEKVKSKRRGLMTRKNAEIRALLEAEEKEEEALRQKLIIPFSEPKNTYTLQDKQENSPENEDKDNRKTPSTWGDDPVKAAVSSIVRDPYLPYCGAFMSLQWNGHISYKVWKNGEDGRVEVRGSFFCNKRQGETRYDYDQQCEDEKYEHESSLKDRIESEINSAIEKVKETYKGYDGDWDVDAEFEGIIR